MRYLITIVIIIIIVLSGCNDDNDTNVATPLPPDKPAWYTPEATADYSEW